MNFKNRKPTEDDSKVPSVKNVKADSVFSNYLSS